MIYELKMFLWKCGGKTMLYTYTHKVGNPAIRIGGPRKQTGGPRK